MGEVTGKEPIYPNLIAEIPGIELETDFEDIENAVEETRAPSLADRAAAARQNANFKSTGMDIKIKGVHSAPNTPFPKSQQIDDNDDQEQPPKLEVGYDSSDDEDSDDKPDDEPDDEPMGPRPPLIRRSDDDEDTILVKDVLEEDEALEDIIEEPEVIRERLGRARQPFTIRCTRVVHFYRYLCITMVEIQIRGDSRNSTRVQHYSTCMLAMVIKLRKI